MWPPVILLQCFTKLFVIDLGSEDCLWACVSEQCFRIVLGEVLENQHHGTVNALRAEAPLTGGPQYRIRNTTRKYILFSQRDRSLYVLVLNQN